MLAAARHAVYADLIASIPLGKVASYGQVARAAGFPRHHREVARVLNSLAFGPLPWQRVLGAGGQIKLTGFAAKEQRRLLRVEGVRFIGKRVDLNAHEYNFE